MPQLGETVTEGKITKWFKAAGDKVAAGDNLFEIETDKTSMEVPATSAGTLTDIRVAAGAVAPVGAVVAVIADGGAATSAATTKPEPAKAAPAKAESAKVNAPPSVPPASSPPAPAPVAAMAASPAWPPRDPFQAVRTPDQNFGPARLSSGAHASPLARRLAAEAGIDLSRLTPTGPHGRIRARDVDSARASGIAASPPLAVGPSAAKVKALYATRGYQEVPLDNMRRTIAARLSEAKQSVPHFYLEADVDIDRLEAVRADANAAAPTAADGAPAFKLSLNDFIIKALAVALQRVPAANAVWAEDRILRFATCDIGVAVALDGGLITPVIRAAETKSLAALSAEMKDLATRARDKKLLPEDYQGGVTTVSNLGMYGVRAFCAIINPPQSTILAVGQAARRPIETQDGAVRFATQMTVTLSCDHRVVDGALGAQLLQAFKHAIEHPIGLMV